MADRSDADFTYSLTDRVIRLSLGELPDFSGAKFDGDFSLSLEQAQRRKHDYVAQQVGIGPGRRLLDLGCGWGPLLAYTRARGGAGVGLTLSSAQVAACRKHGLEVYLQDAREIDQARFGTFDAVASLGAFEHFCSPDDYQAGRQEEIYRDLFARVSSVLPTGGRFYLQTMVFGDLGRRSAPALVRRRWLRLAAPAPSILPSRRGGQHTRIHSLRAEGATSNAVCLAAEGVDEWPEGHHSSRMTILAIGDQTAWLQANRRARLNKAIQPENGSRIPWRGAETRGNVCSSCGTTKTLND